MVNLIMKDILMQKKQVIISFFYIAFVMFTFQGIGTAVYTVGAISFTYLMVVNSCAYEDKNKADVMINSLPVKRTHIVAAKYLSVFVFLIMATLGYMFFSVVLKISGVPIKVYPLTLQGVIGGVAAACLMNSIYFPVFFRLGYLKSRVVSFILFFSFFFGVPYLVRAFQKWENGVLNGAVTNFIKSQGDITIAVLTAAAAFLLLLLSYGLSVKFYMKREF